MHEFDQDDRAKTKLQRFWNERYRRMGGDAAHSVHPAVDRLHWKLWMSTADVVPHGRTVLDWGCGDGRWFLFLKKRWVNVYGWDVSSAARMLARQRVLREMSNVTVLEGGPLGRLRCPIDVACLNSIQEAIRQQSLSAISNELAVLTGVDGRLIVLHLWPRKVPRHWRGLEQRAVLSYSEFVSDMGRCGWRVVVERPVSVLDARVVFWLSRMGMNALAELAVTPSMKVDAVLRRLAPSRARFWWTVFVRTG